MTRYEWRHFPLDDDRGFDAEGRVVAVRDTPTAHETGTYALVEVGDGDPEPPATFSADPEGVDDEEVFYCTGTKSSGGRCTREVDEPGDRCWQHPEE